MIVHSLRLWLALLTTLLLGGVGAQAKPTLGDTTTPVASAMGSEDKARLTIHTFPSGAKVIAPFGTGEDLGLTGGDNKIALTIGPPHVLTLRLEGYQDRDITVVGGDIRRGRYPADGVVWLEANSWWQRLWDQLRYRPWLLLLALGPLGAAAYGRRQSRLRQEQEEQFKTLVDSGADPEQERRSLILQQIGEYRVVSLLGKGGMAEVYTAVPADTLDMSAAVAVKVMNQEMREQPDWVARFEREIVVSQQLVHPGIVEVRDWGWHGERLYLIMELIEGRELRKLLPELKGDWGRLGDILSQLFLAVDYAHHRGIYHRDLKPENIMVSKAERVKVMDFGLARAVDSSTLTQAGSAMGTPRYIAPEAVSGSTADDRADQYSLGVIAYEMIAGQAPFESDEILYLLYAHAHLPPPPPSTVVADLPQAVDDVLLKMLSKDPRDRYRDVEEARVELLGSLKGLL